MPTRRGVITGAAATSATLGFAQGQDVRSFFGLKDTYLDAAFTHPLGGFAASAARDYIAARQADPLAVGPAHNARRRAVERFASLVGSEADSIAVVPSTMGAENLVLRSLGIGPDAGVVTDALHYDASLVLYGELARKGTSVSVVRPRNLRIDLADVAEAITDRTRLVAVSLVSGLTGFTHDLAELCALAHRKGALVYADIIQAAGAVELDLPASGVDFAACGTYKWLMGDFGCAFLYVRPDRLERMQRVEVGWRQVDSQEGHVLPFEPPGPPLGSYSMGSGTSAKFEVSTPAWQALAIASASVEWIQAAGVSRLAARRTELLAQLADGLRGSEWIALTPAGSHGPIAAYALRDAARRIRPKLVQAGIRISVYEHRVRISPSIYNDRGEIDRLIAVMRSI